MSQHLSAGTTGHALSAVSVKIVIRRDRLMLESAVSLKIMPGLHVHAVVNHALAAWQAAAHSCAAELLATTDLTAEVLRHMALVNGLPPHTGAAHISVETTAMPAVESSDAPTSHMSAVEATNMSAIEAPHMASLESPHVTAGEAAHMAAPHVTTAHVTTAKMAAPHLAAAKVSLLRRRNVRPRHGLPAAMTAAGQANRGQLGQ
ncbi:MAG: hypothetical protein U0872_12495 [Planctomycetaceae bacterium]